MKIHEYQAKAILAKYKVPIPRGEVAFSADEAAAAAQKIGGSVVVKAQIHAGGRGKGGGVKVARDAAEATELAKKILGMTLIVWSSACSSKKRCPSNASCIWGSCWIACKVSRYSWRRQPAGWRSKRSPRKLPS
jgi:hypothetical protein